MLPAGRVILLLAILAMAFPAWGQKASNWRVFKASDGLAESFVTSVAVSGRSNVWVKHHELNAISVLNGHKVKTIPAPGSGFYRVIESRSGQIWTAYPEGLQEFRNNTWIKYPIRQIRQEFQTNLVRHARAFPLIPLKQGRVLFLVSDRLMEFNGQAEPVVTTIRLARDTSLGKFNDMVTAPDGSIWVACENGLGKLATTDPTRPEALRQFVIEPSLQVRDLQQPLADGEGGVVVLGESLQSGRKVVVYFDGRTWKVYHTPDKNVRQAWRGYDGSIWAITISALLRLDSNGVFVESDEVVASQYFDVATEPQGVFWIATSDGLFRFAPLTWRTPEPIRHKASPVHALLNGPDGRVYAAFGNGLAVHHNGRWTNHAYPESIDKFPQPGELLFSLPKGQIALGANGRLIRFNPFTGRFVTIPHPNGARVKPLGLTKDGGLYVQVLEQGAITLESFDGERFRQVSIPPLPIAADAELAFLFAGANGDLWLSCSSGLWHFHDGKWQSGTTDGTAPDSALCMLDVGGGKIWCGTRDAVWEFDGKMWSVVRASLDRVNAMMKGRDGTIWVATNSGIHRSTDGDWALNNAEDGLPSSAVTKVLEDNRGGIWAGTMRGLSAHHPEADRDPPRTTFDTRSTAEDGTVTLTFSGTDKWKFTQAEHLLFSTRLDEQEWSSFQPKRSVSFSELSGGKHYFQVRAMDRTWNIDPKPTLLEFELPIPWYQDPRLILIGVAGLGTALFFAGLAFNRHRRLVRSYAEVERIVELRTQQLKEADNQLLHSQKMTALGTLAAGVAHDFNSILSIIKGSAQIIESNLDDREKIRTRTQRINTVVDQGTELVQAMLGFSRPGSKDVELCDVNALVTDTMKLLGDRFQREVNVSLSLQRDLPQVCVSKSSIQQIVLNFIFNAADAVNGSGKIIVRSGTAAAPAADVVLSPAPSPQYVLLSVQDFGSGISAEILPRIFEPFFTTKSLSSRRGTGLGLSIVYELAKQMGAGLAVQSTVGKGSTFTLLLPLTAISSRDEKTSET